MRHFTVLFFLLLLYGDVSSAQIFGRRQQRQWPKTEGELMHKVLRCLSHKDTAGYYDLFPPFDTLWSMVMHNPDKSPEVQKELNTLKEHPQALIEFDPLYNKDIIGRFCHVLAKGEDSGVQWRNVIMARYELRRQDPTRAMLGFDRIAPDRFRGYMFVSDGFNRVIFCISIMEVQKIKGRFLGGQVLNILEAKTVEEFNMKEQREREWFEWVAAHPDSVIADTTAVADTVEKTDTTANPLAIAREEGGEEEDLKREVVDRKYYEGLMDNEIPIKMYVRYMRIIPGKAQQFDGLYKLGDGKKYMKLEITRSKDGKWIIEDESAIGTMELTLKGRTYTGNWINAEENGFDVEMTQTGTVKGKIETFDAILDRGASGKVDESQFEEEETETEKKGKEKTDEKKDKNAKDKKEEAKKELTKKEKKKKERKRKREKKKKA